MRSDWIEMGSNPVTGVLVKRAPKAKDGPKVQGWPRVAGNHQESHEPGKDFPPEPTNTADFGLLTSRTEREQTSAVLRH